MICSSGIGFNPLVDGKRLTFGFEGIWQGTALLYDHQTSSLWMHITGECVAGKHKGVVLPRMATGRHTTWGDWKRLYPQTQVMAPDPKFASGSGASQHAYFTRRSATSGARYLPTTFPATMQSRDGRMPLHELLYGIVVDGTARAYPFRAMTRAGVVEELVNRAPVTVWYDRRHASAAAFDPIVAGKVLSFRSPKPGRIVDQGTQSIWTLDGECVKGSLKGTRLKPLHGLKTEWYGWFVHHQDTSVYSE